jgi:glycine/D-amino acid oxidase-like deaminating enzyme
MLTAKAARVELALDALAGIKDGAGAVIDPYRACLGLAAAAEERGATLFERSVVRKITFDRKKAGVVLDGGTIRAGRVILATGVPTTLCRALIRHFWFKTAYLALTERIPAPVRRQLVPRGVVVRDVASPPHLIRRVGEDRVLVAGGDIETPPPRLAERTVVQRTGQLMYELSLRYPEISGVLPQYGWSAPYALTADGLPFIGPHRNFPHQLFALGDASRGVTGAYLASRLLLRYYMNEVDADDEMFAFTRYER